MLLRDVLPFLLSAAAVMLTTGFITSMLATQLSTLNSQLSTLIARILLAALLYYALMRLFRVQILNECLQFFNRRKSNKYE